jgi:hypothetical protein
MSELLQRSDETTYRVQPHTDVGGSETATAFAPEHTVRVATSADNAPLRTADSLARIYPLRAFVSPDLRFAMERLDVILPLMDEAVQALQGGEFALADDFVQRVVPELPDLLFCSSLGDGFSALLVGAHYALTNPREEILTVDQLMEIRLVFRTLKFEPFLKLDSAISRLLKLEATGLTVDPPIDFVIGELAPRGGD